MCDWKFRLGLPPNSKTTDELNLQPIFKPNFLFYSPINKLSLVQIQTLLCLGLEFLDHVVVEDKQIKSF